MKSARKSSLFYGWIIVFVTWMAYFLLTTPLSYGGNVLMLQMAQEGVIQKSTIAYASSGRFFVTAVFSVVVGALVGKKGHRFTIALGAVIMMAGQFLFGWASLGDRGIILGFSLMGFGMISGGVITGPSIINNWFDQNRSLPMSLIISAGAIGGFIFPVLTNAVAEQLGWRAGWLLFSVLAAVSLVLTLLLMKERPEEIGECRDGKAWCRKHKAAAEAAEEKECGEKASGENVSVKEISSVTRYRFLVMAFLSFMNRAFFAGFTGFLLLYGVQTGLTAAQAALALSVYNIAGLAGRLIAGASDRIPLPKHLLNAASYLPLAAGGMIIFTSSSAGTYFLGSALYGFGVGFAFSLYPILVPEYFGREKFSMLFSIFNALAGVGSTLTPILMQAIADAVGGYQYTYLIMAAAPLLCAVLAMTIPVQQSKARMSLIRIRTAG